MEFLDDWLARTAGHANRLEHQGNPARGLFVIGTDTDVGKSYVACLLIRHLVARGVVVGAYKPVASGVVAGQRGDADRLALACGRPLPGPRVCPQSFAAPLAPPVAAAREGRVVNEQLLRDGAAWWRSQCDVLVVEGAGGALSPLAIGTTVLDLAQELNYPVVLVAEHRLGMMNHTLLTLEALASRGLETLALVVNHSQRRSEPRALAETLGCLLPFCGNLPCWVLEHGGSALSRPAI